MHQPTDKSQPTWKQGLLLFFGGIVLAASCCAGVFAYDGKALGNVLAIGFFASLFVILCGLVSLFIRMARG